MHVLIAPDSFKESLRAHAVARAIMRGWQRGNPRATYSIVPLGDGGEGTLDALLGGARGKRIYAQTVNAAGEPIRTPFAQIDKGTQTYYIESAACIGLGLLRPEQRNPWHTHSFGVGLLIRRALDCGARHILVGLGGSATNDGGTGLASALGYRLLDQNGRDIPYGAQGLSKLARIENPADLQEKLRRCTITALCDVRNPLCGSNGATYTYALQKGARDEDLPRMESAMAHYADILERHFCKPIRRIPYTGSAGGLGAALYAFLCARLVSGASFLAEHLRLSEHIGRADLVITGEGKLDSQTLHGKVVHTVVSLAEKQGRPVIVLAGTVALTGSMKKALPNAACFSIVPGPMTLAEALKATRANLERTAEQLARYCTRIPLTTGTTPPVRQSHTKPEKKPTMQIPQTKHLHTDTHLRRKANLRPTKTQRS